MENLYTKTIVMPLADHGGVSKSTTLLTTAAGLTAKGIGFENFDADSDHKTYFAAYSSKNKNGESKAEQDSKTGCKLIDINENPQEIVNSVAIEKSIGLVDTPARATTAILESFGPEGLQSFFDTFAFHYTLPLFQVPWVDDDKSPKTLDKIFQYLDMVNFSDFDPGFAIKIQVVLNKGLMYSNSKSMPTQALAALQSSISLKSLQNDPRFIVQVATIGTQLTLPAINALKGKTIHQALAETAEPNLKILFMGLIRDGKNLTNFI